MQKKKSPNGRPRKADAEQAKTQPNQVVEIETLCGAHPEVKRAIVDHYRRTRGGAGFPSARKSRVVFIDNNDGTGSGKTYIVLRNTRNRVIAVFRWALNNRLVPLQKYPQELAA